MREWLTMRLLGLLLWGYLEATQTIQEDPDELGYRRGPAHRQPERAPNGEGVIDPDGNVRALAGILTEGDFAELQTHA